MDHLSHEDTYLGLTYEQFISLRTAAVACSSLSLFASFITSVTYVCLRLIYRSRADRVSLRCVWVASFANVVVAILNIAVVAIDDASRFCLSSGVALQFFGILGTGFLTIVGINLLIVFVLNFNRTSKRRLQLFYFSFILLYCLCSIVFPTYVAQHPCVSAGGHSSCWFNIFYESSRCGDAVWIDHYSFLMFLVVIAFGCSVIATIKLVREQHTKFGKILRREPVQRRHQSAIIARVLLRCILYPLIPFIANIWGFIAQLLVFRNNRKSSYELAMFGTVFSCLEGVYITIVFFTDPTVTHILSEEYKKRYQYYVNEYQCLKVVKLHDANDANSSSNRVLLDALISNCTICQQQETATTTTTLSVEQDDYDITDQQQQQQVQEQQPQEMNRREKSLFQPQQQQLPLQPNDFRMIPVRCVNIPPCILQSTSPSAASRATYSTCPSPALDASFIYRLSATDAHRLERKDRKGGGGGPPSSPIITYDHPDTTKAYIPYRHPQFASFMHWLLSLINKEKQDNGDDGPSMSGALRTGDDDDDDDDDSDHQQQQSVAIHIPHDDNRRTLSETGQSPPPSGEHTLLAPLTSPLSTTSTSFSSSQL
ncbi:hypothetical protein BDB00DRAFT_943713 [Zychaea mexicana]|uniref:uncharacterized protein n=1 Tax=Zychaea mexicana TaxID=64656 RepID=UPI0022FE4111|nr:uncharacterized protein BDB00DRAFT_943713 [Zychaea mexicana]KAI9471360.1 hypothetical protein BDB00DRAFT_943713 [Zychaea mexicana]